MASVAAGTSGAALEKFNKEDEEEIGKMSWTIHGGGTDGFYFNP